MKQHKLKSLLTYIPAHLAHKVVNDVQKAIFSEEERIEGTIIVAKLSGLTNLFEALAKTGEGSATELHKICTNYFDSVFNEVEKYGGDILYFDDVEMHFFVVRKPRQHYSKCVRTAVQITLNIQKIMLQFNQIQTSAGVFSLTMKTAVAVGKIYHTVLGKTGKQAKYIFTSPFIEEAKTALRHAIPGQVLISDDAIAKGCGVELEEVKNTYSSISKITQSVSRPTPKSIDVKNIPARDQISLIEKLSSFVPKEIFRNLSVIEKVSEGDRRRATLIALHFEGVQFDMGQTGSIQDYFLQVSDIVAKTGGYLLDLQPNLDGGYFVVAFGAPILSKKQEDQAICCALELMELSPKFEGIKQRIGITTGFVYAGVIGSKKRKRYSLIGNTISLTFSIVDSAKNDNIWVDKYVYERTVDTSEFTKLDPIMISGHSWPVQIYQLLDLKPEFDKTTILADEEEKIDGESGQLEFYEIVHNALSNKGQFVVLCGKEGKKSQLANNLMAISQESGFMSFVGKCCDVRKAKPFSLWQDVFVQFFELDVALSSRDKEGKLIKIAQMVDPNLVDLIPLFADVLPLELTETETTKSLSITERKAKFFYLLREILLHHISKHPTVFLLEKADLADELSMELLDNLIQLAMDKPVMIVATCTDTGKWTIFQKYANEPFLKRIKITQ